MSRKGHNTENRPDEYNVDGFCTILQNAVVSTPKGDVALKRLIPNAEVLNVVDSGKQIPTNVNAIIRGHDSRWAYAINGETAFFTAAQIFHTTTGLRAVDAQAAQKLHPGLKVRFLKPGHVVYRLHADRSSHEQVQLKTIESLISMSQGVP